MPPEILTPEDAANHVADGETQTEVYAGMIADASASHAQWRDSRPHEETVGLPASPVVQPPDNGESAPGDGGEPDSPTGDPAHSLSDDDLRAEAQRRGWHL